MDDVNTAGYTALHRAAIWNQIDCAKILLKANASTILKTKEGGMYIYIYICMREREAERLYVCVHEYVSCVCER